MHSLNLFSIKDVLSTNDEDILNAFFSINDIDIKPHEKSGILTIVNNLLLNNVIGPKASGYFLSVKCNNLMQEEFDILRFGQEKIINIEVKSTMPEKGILLQMQRHNHLLSTLGKTTCCFTYVEDENTLYKYEDSTIEPSSFSSLCSLIEDDYSESNKLDSIDTSTILISPYSDPEAFSMHSYFLTNQQAEFKSKILASNKRYISISGKAGSGKSLLLFDIAKDMIAEGLSVCIVFCANLNQYQQVAEQTGVPISLIRNFSVEQLNSYDVIIFDEAQRLRSEQYNQITESFSGSRIIFSVDQQQTLHREEIKLRIEEKSRTLPNSESFQLSKRIRVNAAIESFAEKFLFFNCPNWNARDFSCIKLTYFTDEKSLREYCRTQYRCNKKIIELTPYVTKLNSIEKMSKACMISLDSHSVIGKEYDDVLLIINKYITYTTDSEGRILLDSNYPEYYPYSVNHCIWEAISRAKKTLEIVFINNKEMYEKASEILKKSIKQK